MKIIKAKTNKVIEISKEDFNKLVKNNIIHLANENNNHNSNKER